jgi:hypothetical protein
MKFPGRVAQSMESGILSKGYKEVPKSFKSEIDWNKWNSDK